MTANIRDRHCPACGAEPGEPCNVPIKGVDTTGWDHDARILAQIIEHAQRLATTGGSS